MIDRHDYTEREIEEAVLHRKPIAARALYILIERRLEQGLGWPDRNFNNSAAGMSSTTATGNTIADGLSDEIVLDKLDRHEPLLPGRRPQTQQSPTAAMNNPQRLSREKSHYAFDDQNVVRTNHANNSITAGLTQEALNELVPASRLTSRKLYHDFVLRKPSAMGGRGEQADEQVTSRRMLNSNSLAPIKPSLPTQRGNVLIVQQTQQQPQHKLKPRSLPNSTLDHANQNGFHLPHDPYASRLSKTPSRTSHMDHTKKSQPSSPTRYHPGKYPMGHFLPHHHFIFFIEKKRSLLLRVYFV